MSSQVTNLPLKSEIFKRRTEFICPPLCLVATIKKSIANSLRYASVTFLVTFIVPWIFIKIKLAERQVDEFGERIIRATASEEKL
jgi:hypothetical protein